MPDAVPVRGEAPEDPAVRLWPAVLVAALCLPVTLAIQIALGIVWALVGGLLGHGITPEQLASSHAFLLLSIVTSQAGFAALAVLGVVLARAAPRPGLGLGGGRLGPPQLLLAMIGTLFVGALAQLWWELAFDEVSEGLRNLGRVFVTAPLPTFLALTVAISVLPALGEELLFRGFLQRHLLRCWHPLAAILLASVLFAGMHLDPQHAWSVLPIGLWLGYVAWRADSLWPAILCHFFNNLVGSIMMRVTPTTVEQTSLAWTLGFMVVGLPAWAATVWCLERQAARQPRSSPT